MESHRFRELCSCEPCADIRALALELAEAARKLRVCEATHERAYGSVVRINERLLRALEPFQRSDGHFVGCPGEQFHDRPEHACEAIWNCVRAREALGEEAL